ncbi:mechanosensitive ion channel family protein [Pseudodonghicola flavimaris]|uniref:Mechanosensitive ion channel n=1 Tax=Pseudodonghicola flavimaris TaxID=3050036 RepID=A0ABT7EWE9_9RHOB|nr:mechanosensitive ion channel domain-containing protein [Pseudodonghicola flavimaris]MDK3016676.1 mechanosensitive ion channel [Pseudodonghicola flavimaris]
MDKELLPPEVETLITGLWGRALHLAEMVLTPGWRQNQVLIILGLIGLSWLLRIVTSSWVQEWTRAREGWPKWRLRMMVQIRQRLSLIYFTFGAWAVYVVMQQITWPSRSYLIGIAATLSTAWLVIALLSRLVQNRTLRRLLTWASWIYATLYALELIDDVEGFLASLALQVGGLKLSALTAIKSLLLVSALLVAARLGTQAASRSLTDNDDISPSMRVLAIKAVQVVLYGLVLMIGIRALGFDLSGLALLSGAVGVGIGFGLQKVVSNLVSGIIILLDRSIKPGDVISLGDTFGWIDSLGARYVSVVTRDGKEYLIPNEDLITSQVVNWSHTNKFVRLDLHFGTSYGDDPHLVRRVAVEAAKGVKRVLSQPTPPVCHIVGFGDSSVDYVLRFWITDPSDGLTNIRGNVFLALWDAFKAEGISIPFPQREVRHLNDPSTALRTPGVEEGTR